MAFGILEPSDSAMPLGTTVLEDIRTPDNEERSSTQIILVPQPSTSPNDPLNWSRWRKELLFATIAFGACATGVIGPLLVPGFEIIAAAFDVTLTKVTLLNGSLVMALGVSAYLCGVLATIYGKRIIYIITTLMLVATCCWGAAAKTYTSLLVSRIFQGLGMGGFFALAGTSSINDVFFVHERGRRVGLWNFSVIVSVNLAPIISGHVIVALSWRWTFWLLAITFGILLVLVILFFPETTFSRNESEVLKDEVEPITLSEKQQHIAGTDIAAGTISSTPAWRRLVGVNIKFTNQSRILLLLVSPFTLLAHPAVVWACLMWAVTFTWVIIQGAIATQIFAAPPYNMTATAIGNLIGIAPLIGSALGTVIGGWACDFLGKFMSIRNKGVYEPEFRLLVMIPFIVTFAVGAFGLGMAVENGLSAMVCGVFLAILNFAVGVGCTGIVAYSNDTCQHRAGESFGLAMLVKSAFAFGLTFMLNDYYAMHGPKVFFFTWAGLTVGVTLLTIPLYVFGKRIRGWTTRVGVL